MSELNLLSTHKLFNGQQRRYHHYSSVNQCNMNFSVYLPALALQGYRRPVLYCLGGLTCTDENF